MKGLASYEKFHLHRQLILLIFVSTVSCVSKLPLCPKPESSFPCICSKSTLESPLDVICLSGNLATVGLPLKSHYRDVTRPIKRLIIKDANIFNLHGPLFDQLNGPESLSIVNSSISSINSLVFSPLISTLKSVELSYNNLTAIPNDAIAPLNVTYLDLTSNNIKIITSKSFPSTNFSSNLNCLNVSHNEINKIESTGLAPLVNLETLNLSYNHLAKLERNQFRSLKKLKILDLSHNKFNSFDRSDFTDLLTMTHLDISYNGNLTKLPQSIFARNAQLQVLDISGNSFKEVDAYTLRGVRFLKKFFASNNAIESIAKRAFSTNTRIKVVDLSHNQLTTVPGEMFSGFSQLDSLDLSHNRISTVEPKAFLQLFRIEINLSHNNLSVIPRNAFVEVMNISTLDLSHNRLTRIHNEAFSESDVCNLYLQNNAFVNSSYIPLGNLTGLTNFNVSFNNLTSINRKSFGLTQNVKLYQTAVIDLSFNRINEISGSMFEKFWALRYLNISNNSLKRLGFGAFGNLPTLLEMDLRNNQLKNVNSGAISGLISLKNLLLANNVLESMPTVSVALTDIDVSNNSIKSISCSAFPMINALLKIDLSNNSLESLSSDSFCNLLTLRYLDLSFNNFSSLDALYPPLQKLSSLQYLNVSFNTLQSINTSNAFGTLPTLFDLNLSHNRIQNIAPYAFNGLLQLLALNLSSNQLKTVPVNSMAGLVSLQTLDLSNNSIARVENRTNSFFEDLLSLEQLFLRGNRISFLTPKSLPSSQWIPYKLKHLDISHNRVESLVTSVGFTTLESINLKSNHVRNLSPGVIGNCSNLKYLDLSHNKLTTIGKNHLSPLKGASSQLERLNLSSNLIDSIESSEISALVKSLRVLDLSKNRLASSWPSHQFASLVNRGARILFNGNSLPCDCQSKINLETVRSGLPNISPQLASKLTIDFDVNNDDTGRFLEAAKAIPSSSDKLNPSMSDWLALTCIKDDSRDIKLAYLDDSELACTEEQIKTVATGEVSVRAVHWVKGFPHKMRIIWFVRDASKDIGKFKIEITQIAPDDGAVEKFESLEVPYTEREYTFENIDYFKNHKICLKTYDSLSREYKTPPGNCVEMPAKVL